MIEKLDKFDYKIFREIEFDYSRSHSDIAKKIRRTKSFVTYRIKKFEENNIISYLPLIDYSRLGYSYYRIIIETILTKEEILSRLSSLKLKTVWMVEKYDTENVIFVLLEKSHSSFQKTWESMYELLSTFVVSKNISIAFKITHLSNNFFYDKESAKKYFITGANETDPDESGEQIKISAHEAKIIENMTANPKIQKRDLAKLLKINEMTLKKHIKNLESKKIILCYQTILNKKILGLQHYKIFMSFEYSNKNKNRLIEILKACPNIVYITESSSEYDLECEAFVYNNNEIRNIYSKLKNDFKFKRLVLSQIKDETKLI